jgi:hypothetical protein
LDELQRQVVTNLSPAAFWQTDWGAITASRSLKFTYSITTKDGNIKGYASGDIQSSDGRPQVLIGEFWQLPPFKPLHGTMEFRRRINESDIEW